MKTWLAPALILWALFATVPVGAVEPNEILADPVLEARARVLGKQLRCLVCQNQSIDDSSAPLARDLRVLVRERLLKGDSNDQVLAFMVARFGDFVLLKPPVKPITYVLWFGPAAIFVIGLIAVLMFYRRRQNVAPAPALSPDEKQRLAEILDDKRDGEAGS